MTLRDHAPQQIVMNYPQHAAALRYRRWVKSGQAEETDARYHDAKPEASGLPRQRGGKGLDGADRDPRAERRWSSRKRGSRFDPDPGYPGALPPDSERGRFLVWRGR